MAKSSPFDRQSEAMSIGHRFKSWQKLVKLKTRNTELVSLQFMIIVLFLGSVVWCGKVISSPQFFFGILHFFSLDLCIEISLLNND